MIDPFDDFHQAFTAAVHNPGALLFTASAITDAGSTFTRIFSSHPDVYPIGGTKSVKEYSDPQWVTEVIVNQRPFLGPDKRALRRFFGDSATIERLGCGAIVNVPVVADGSTIGTMNFVAAEGSYDQQSVEGAAVIAHRSVTLFADRSGDR